MHRISIVSLFAVLSLATAPQAHGVCGDFTVEFENGETCDDGNTDDGDSCPSDCRIEECTRGEGTTEAQLEISVPGGTDIAAATILAVYPDGTVGIPGSARADSVVGRLLDLPFNAIVTPNDLDYGIRLVSFTPDLSSIVPGPFTTIEFDNCAQARAAPEESDFSCIVEDASDASFNAVDGATCVIRLETGAPACGGDCSGDGEVTVDEIINGVNIALGQGTVDSCPAMDTSGDGEVTVDEILTAVNNALNGCPQS